MTSERRKQTRRWLLIVVTVGAALTAVALTLLGGIETGLTRSKAMLDSVRTTVSKHVTPAANTEDIGQAQSRPQVEAEHAHAEGTAQSMREDKEDEAKSVESAERSDTLTLASDELAKLGIEVASADEGQIALQLERPAEAKFDSDHVVHVVPRLAGVVSQVDASQGQNVLKDQILAVLDSRELAELKAAYLGDSERRDLARDNFERERRLWEKRISPEKTYLAAKTALAEADIALAASEQKLRALGLLQQSGKVVTSSQDANLTRYEIRAPIAGTIIERHISLGEAVATDKDVFVISETNSVWVDITIYPEDLASVSAGQTAQIDVGDGSTIEGKIAFVTVNMQEQTRTAIARVIVHEGGRQLKPGLFVKARIEVLQDQVGVRLPKTAIQNFNNDTVVFVQEGEEFAPRPVKLGRENSQYVQILSGLNSGESYVAKGAFTIKALIQKSQMGEGHGH